MSLVHMPYPNDPIRAPGYRTLKIATPDLPIIRNRFPIRLASQGIVAKNFLKIGHQVAYRLFRLSSSGANRAATSGIVCKVNREAN